MEVESDLARHVDLGVEAHNRSMALVLRMPLITHGCPESTQHAQKGTKKPVTFYFILFYFILYKIIHYDYNYHV